MQVENLEPLRLFEGVGETARREHLGEVEQRACYGGDGDPVVPLTVVGVDTRARWMTIPGRARPRRGVVTSMGELGTGSKSRNAAPAPWLNKESGPQARTAAIHLARIDMHR